MKAQPCTTKVTSVIMHEIPQRNKRNPPSRWHHGNSEEQKIHAERFCVVEHLLYRREIILINMYIYTKCDAYVN